MLERIKNTASLIRKGLGIAEGSEPEVGITLGSGLGALADRIKARGTLEYSDIPGFPHSTVVGHKGRFIYGELAGRRVIAMQGRVHYYEGYSMEEVVLPIRAMCELGISTFIVSNAAGGMNPRFRTGDIMAITDHINLLPNPLIGPNPDWVGPRFPDMSAAYDPALIEIASQVALDNGIPLRYGVYVGSSGPTFETPAEYRYFRAIGADATGMSTTPEVIAARHRGVRVFGLSLISNMGLGEQAGVNSHEEVFETSSRATDKMCLIVEGLIGRLEM